MDLLERPFYQELIFTASRSSGAGGQNVNKVASKVELRFHVTGSALLSPEEKDMITRNLANRITKEGILQLQAQASRSQLANKQTVTKNFFQLLARALQKKKVRRPTKVSASAKTKRLTAKKLHGQKKKFRNPRPEDTE